MLGPLGQIIMLIGLTSALRVLGRVVGPRRSGRLMGLPSTTAVVLLTCALERGLDEALLTAQVGLAGLVAAASFPVVFARSVGAGAGLARSIAAGIAGYLAVTLLLVWLPETGLAGCVAGSVLGVMAACVAGGRVDLEGASARPTEVWVMPWWWRLMLTRCGVPGLYVGVVRGLRWLAGPGWSGRFVTFPGGSVALLVATFIEEGPATAGRLASAMPGGSFATLAFLAVFRAAAPGRGLAAGMVLGYLAAIAVLLVPDAMGRWGRWPRRVLVGRVSVWLALRATVGGSVRWLQADPFASTRFRSARRVGGSRRFAPRVECLA